MSEEAKKIARLAIMAEIQATNIAIREHPNLDIDIKSVHLQRLTAALREIEGK